MSRRSGLSVVLLLLMIGTASADEVIRNLAPFENRKVTEIVLLGREVTQEFVITRELETRVGEPLHAAVVAEDINRLDNLSIFAEIGVSAEADGPGVRLTYRVKEMPSWIPLIGASYNEQDGLSGGPKISALNLFGRAISVNGKAYFGGADKYELNISWPWISGDHVSFNFRGARLSRFDELNDFQETSYEFTPQIGRYVGVHGRLKGKFSLFEMKSDVDGKTLSPDNHDTLPRLGASFGWDTRDSWRFPRSGWLNEIEVWRTGFGGGEASFWTANLDVRRWIPTAKNQRLMLSGLASLQSGQVNQDIPVYMTYNMGGANSIRGYDVIELGKKVKGKNQLIGTAEYSFQLLPLQRWDIWKFAFRLGLDFALFADVGTAWSESTELNKDRFRGGAGAGLRLLVPGAEMVRLDVGWSAQGGFQFHIAGGTKPAGQRNRLR
jgi:outer membrane protein insertion porin family